VVFQQNRHLLGVNSLRQPPAEIALHIAFERAVSMLFRHYVDEYVVQIKTMAEELARWGSSRPGNAVRGPI
jgi:hypothetical protein